MTALKLSNLYTKNFINFYPNEMYNGRRDLITTVRKSLKRGQTSSSDNYKLISTFLRDLKKPEKRAICTC
jgi:hypothetical protein